MEARTVKQTEVFAAAEQFARVEGILPAPESSHAIRVAIDEALKCKETGEAKNIVLGLTGTGYFDMFAYGKFNDGLMTDYIPTDDELAGMPFTSEENKAAYKNFLATDKYTSAHRGEYSERNGAVAPWLNRINVRVAEDFYFNVAGRKQTLEIGLDVKNVGNLINSNWGVYKQLSSNNILNYADGKYTFSEPTWKNYNDLASTWQMLLSARWFF